MTSIQQNPPPKIPSDLLIGMATVLAVLGIPTMIRYFLDQQQYESGLQSYKLADCGVAISQFNKVINAFRLADLGNYVPQAIQKKAECEFFDDAVKDQKNGAFASALVSYAGLAVYNNSPLLKPARASLIELFQKAKTKSLTTIDVCDRIGILAENNLLPQSDANLPLLYSECGNLYESDKIFTKASSIYEQFLKRYPDHTLSTDIKRSLARSNIADIKSKGVRQITPLGRVGNTTDGSTVIEIQNASPSKMLITFSGKTPRFEEIESCKDCVVHTNNSPKVCPENGNVGRYTFEPSQYEVAIRMKSDNGSYVKPWAGNWNLESGAKYKICFFITQDPIDEMNSKKGDFP